MWLFTRGFAFLQLGAVKDTRRFQAILQAFLDGETPWAQTRIEYPPGAWLAMLVGRPWAQDAEAFAHAFMALCGLAEILVVIAIIQLARDEDDCAPGYLAALIYVLASFPLIGVILRRHDILMMAPLLWSLVLFRKRPAWSDVLLAIAAFIKLIPLFLVPLWFFKAGFKRSARVVVIVALLCAPAGPALLDMLAFHAERGLHIETLFASPLLVLHLLRVITLGQSEDHLAHHLVHPLADVFSTVAPILTVLAVLWISWRKRESDLLLSTTLVLLAPLVFGKLFSMQFTLWFLPAICIFSSRKSRLITPAWAFLVAGIGFSIFPMLYKALTEFHALPILLVVTRNAIVLVFFLALWRERPFRLPAPSSLPGLAALAAWATAILSTVRDQYSADTPLHAAIGRDILEQRALPWTDPYTVLGEGRPFIAHEWLTEVLFSVVDAGLPEWGFTFLAVECGALVLLGIAQLAPDFRRHTWVRLALLLPLSLMCMGLVMARPHVFSMMLLAFLLVTTERWRATRRITTLLPLVPAHVLWANLHGGFLLGPVTLFAIGAAALVEKPTRNGLQPVVVGLACLGATLVNPYGIHLHALALRLVFDSGYVHEFILEWRPFTEPAFRDTLLGWLGPIVAALVVTTLLAARRKASPIDWMLGALACVMAVRAVRFLPEMALFALPVLARLLPTALRRVVRPAALLGPGWAGMLASCLALSVVTLEGFPSSPNVFVPLGTRMLARLPEDLAAYLRTLPRGTRVYLHYEDGALLRHEIPGLRAAVDPRIDMYGPERFALYRRSRAGGADLLALLDGWKLDVVAVPNTSQYQPVLTTLAHTRGWHPAWGSPTHTAYVRDGPSSP